MSFVEIKPEELRDNPCTLFGRDWLLLTAENENGANAMTVGWGGIGVMWGKNVCFVVVRPERYTHEILEKCTTFSLAATADRELLGYCGKVSGRNEPKLAARGVPVEHIDGTPYIASARLVLTCRTLYADDLKRIAFVDPTLAEKWYGGGYHTLYIAEIERVLVSE